MVFTGQLRLRQALAFLYWAATICTICAAFVPGCTPTGDGLVVCTVGVELHIRNCSSWSPEYGHHKTAAHKQHSQVLKASTLGLGQFCAAADAQTKHKMLEVRGHSTNVMAGTGVSSLDPAEAQATAVRCILTGTLCMTLMLAAIQVTKKVKPLDNHGSATALDQHTSMVSTAVACQASGWCLNQLLQTSLTGIAASQATYLQLMTSTMISHSSRAPPSVCCSASALHKAGAVMPTSSSRASPVM